MGWEKRRRGGLYYTRSKKVRGRVVREYVGGGLLGQLAALSDAERRAKRKADRMHGLLSELALRSHGARIRRRWSVRSARGPF